VVIEAEKAKHEGKEKVILFNFSGRGLLDLAGYEKFFSGEPYSCIKERPVW
jgi:tryptophan synthase beta chain